MQKTFIDKFHNAHEPLPAVSVAIAAPRRLCDRREACQRTINHGKRHIDSRLDELRADANEPLFRLLSVPCKLRTHLIQDPLSMHRAHLRTQMNHLRFMLCGRSLTKHSLIKLPRLFREVHDGEHIAAFFSTL